MSPTSYQTAPPRDREYDYGTASVKSPALLGKSPSASERVTQPRGDGGGFDIRCGALVILGVDQASIGARALAEGMVIGHAV